MQVQTHVGPAKATDGLNLPDLRSSNEGQVIVSELHGKYTESMLRGKLFFGTTASTGIALIVPATTGNHPTLWNQAGSGVNLSLVRLSLTYVSGANAPTAIEWATVGNTGSNIGTAAPVVTFTDVAPLPALIGGGGKSKVRWAPAVNTYVVAPAFVLGTGIGLDTMAAASTNAPFTVNVDYDGEVGLSPGNTLSLCTQAATSTALFQVAVFWEEIDIT